MGNALAVYEKVGDPVALATNEKMMVAVATFVGCSLQTAPAVLLTCQLQGIDLMDYLRNYHPVNGRPTKQTQAAVADFLTLHKGKQRIVKFGPELSVVELTDRNGDVTTWTLTLDEACESGWPFKSDGKTYKDNWGSSVKRADMLYYRNVSRALRKVCPSIFAGLLSSEEAADAGEDEVAVAVQTAERRPPASEILKQQAAAANGHADAVVASVVESTPTEAAPIHVEAEVVDADEPPFLPEAGALPASVAEPVPVSELGSPAGYATRSQLSQLDTLREMMKLTPDEWNAALARRHVLAADLLTREQAAELLDKMKERLAVIGRPQTATESQPATDSLKN